MPARLCPDELTVPIHIRVLESQADQVKAIAEKTGLTRSRIGALAVEQFLANYEQKEPQAS